MPTLDHERLTDACVAANADERFRWLARGLDADLLVAAGEDEFRIEARDGTLDEPTEAGEFPSFDLRIGAPGETWERLLSASPSPLYHDLVAAWLQGDLEIEGDVALALRYVGALRRLVALLSEHERPTGDPATRPHGTVESPEGRYVWVEQGGRSHRLYYERAGEGDVPLVCLHTAGADSRQWRHLLADDRARERFTLYAFDMPSHGRSFPPMDAGARWRGGYELTTDRYRDL
ncbi:MAG: alpha/beta fold hydrolase, partial [Halolamina sp.]